LGLFIYMDSLRALIRNILSEISNPDEYNTGEDQHAFAQAQSDTPEMIETEKLKAFLDSEGIFGFESDLISILEGNPTYKVQSDLEAFMAFKSMDKPLEHLGVEEMLDLYLELNHMSQYRQQILSYAKWFDPGTCGYHVEHTHKCSNRGGRAV